MAGLSLLNSLANLLSQQGQGQSAPSRVKVQYSSATCLDPECHTTLYFPSHEASVECPSCGQRHTVADLPDKQEVSADGKSRMELAKLKQTYKTGKAPELVKVKGISNYQCKLLSPLLTRYGMDKATGSPKTLKDLGMGEIFDCGKLANRAFSIDESHFKVVGYGRDRSGSQKYLQDTLKELQAANGGVECLVPVHADGDGHCLVHALSRCLVGRELFWHALRTNIHDHLTSKQALYKEMFKDFIEDEEWTDIIAESAPDFHPPDGQSLGLRNIHVFALANVLKRPIILLDSLSGLQCKGDYSGIFLPSLNTPAECSYKAPGGDLVPNSAIVIAWSSSGRNHFIPLVPVKGRPLPKLPVALQPKVWGSDEQLLKTYVTLDDDGSMVVSGGKELPETYLAKLVACMERLFYDKHQVVPSLVAEVDQFVYRSAGCVGVSAEVLINTTHSAVCEKRLFRCLICSALSCVPAEWLSPGGTLFNKAVENVSLEDGQTYSFPFDGVSASYNEADKKLVPVEVSCFFCVQLTRLVKGSGGVVYQNGDRTDTVSQDSRCGCGYMHFWDGQEYDNLPQKVPLKLMWGGISKEIAVHWFQYESDPSRNSNVYEVAQKAINDHFPGEFGSERLVQEVVDRLLAVSESLDKMEQVTGHHPAAVEKVSSPSASQDTEAPPADYTLPSSKIIMTGQKSKSLHKEELNASETERRLKRKIEENAPKQQSAAAARRSKDKTTTSPRNKTPPPPVKTTPPQQAVKGNSPSPTSQPAKKKIKVTSSNGRTANLTLEPTVTFVELQTAIERELSIPAEKQRLRCGFPPKELRPGADPTDPLDLANGERVSVDIIETRVEPPIEAIPLARSIGESPGEMTTQNEAQKTLDALMQLMRGEMMDLWSIAQGQPGMFQRGGEYYQQVVEQYGSQVKQGTHLQFKEFPNKVFAFNVEKERLDLCLGLEHIPVGPLTPEQEQRAIHSAKTSSKTALPSDEAPAGEDSVFTGAYKMTGPKVKAFSGEGRTLSSGGGGEVGVVRRPYTQADDSTRGEGEQDHRLLETARLGAQRNLEDLQSIERELQLKVRSLNRELVAAEQDGGSVSSLESRLLDSSSELKQVREKIKGLTTMD